MNRTTRPHAHDAPHSSLRSYSLGFAFSVLLTLGAFWAASSGYRYAFVLILALALLQIGVQLIFFLHFGKRGAPRSHQFIFAFSLLIIAIVVGGTLWIMTNLDHLHMPASSMDDLYQGGTVAPQYELK